MICSYSKGNESDSESSDDMEEIGGFGNTTKPDKVDAMSSGKLTLLNRSRLFELMGSGHTYIVWTKSAQI